MFSGVGGRLLPRINHDNIFDEDCSSSASSSERSIGNPAYQEALRKASGSDGGRTLVYKAEEKKPTSILNHPFEGVIPKQDDLIEYNFPINPKKVLNVSYLKADFYTSPIDFFANRVLCSFADHDICSGGVFENKKPTVNYHFARSDWITSVKWLSKESFITGSYSRITGDSYTTIFDGEVGTEKFRLGLGPRKRVTNISLSKRDTFLVTTDTGGVLLVDTRMKKVAGVFEGLHNGTVCNIVKHPNEIPCFATGGNDKKVNVWDERIFVEKKPLLTVLHSAAVRAIAWHPIREGIIVTGGGTDDQKIKVTSIKESKTLSVIEVGSQISNIIWSNDGSFFVSTGGSPENAIKMWAPTHSDLSGFQKVHEVNGAHGNKVLFAVADQMNNSPYLVTASGDQTIKFWDVFPKNDDWKDSIRKPTARLSGFDALTVR